jgi:hypothetical protein
MLTGMAQSGRVVERISEAAGMKPRAANELLRWLRARCMVPSGERGRGTLQGQYAASDLVNVLLGLGAHHVPEAADAAEKFRGLRYLGTICPGSETAEPYVPGLFGQVLDDIVTGLALELMGKQQSGSLRYAPDWIELSLQPLCAHLGWYGRPELPARIDFYGGSPTSVGAVFRKTQIGREMLAVVAELLADTAQHRPDLVVVEKGIAALPARKTAIFVSTSSDTPVLAGRLEGMLGAPGPQGVRAGASTSKRSAKHAQRLRHPAAGAVR